MKKKVKVEQKAKEDDVCGDCDAATAAEGSATSTRRWIQSMMLTAICILVVVSASR